MFNNFCWTKNLYVNRNFLFLHYLFSKLGEKYKNLNRTLYVFPCSQWMKVSFLFSGKLPLSYALNPSHFLTFYFTWCILQHSVMTVAVEMDSDGQCYYCRIRDCLWLVMMCVSRTVCHTKTFVVYCCFQKFQSRLLFLQCYIVP